MRADPKMKMMIGCLGIGLMGGSAWAWKAPGVFPLTSVTESRGAGLSLRNLSAEHRSRLKQQATDFAAFRKKNLAAKNSADFLSTCISDSKSNPFCEAFSHMGEDADLVTGDATPPAPGTDSDPEDDLEDEILVPPLGVKEIANLVLEGNLPALKPHRRRDVYKALKRIVEVEGWSRLETFKSQALNPLAPCPTVSTLVALGMVAENEFPESSFRELTIQAYRRVHECAPQYSRVEGMDPDVALARYRLSLLNIWAKDCAAAAPVLTLLSADKEGTFFSRSLYWRARCAEARGDKLQVEVLKTTLMKTHPLGYHTLLANQDRLGILQNQVHLSTPQVRLETERKSELNSLVLAVELLLSEGDLKSAREILHGLKDSLPGTESEFQLYVALLASQAEAHIYPFQVLGRLFREDPRLLTSETLEIFYPLKFYQVISGASQGFDPYFLAALIRQESGFNPGARSRVGAAGLMQLMPRTARQVGGVRRNQLLNPGVNVRVGTRYLAQLMSKFRNDVELVLASYNAGPQKVEEWVRRYPIEDRVLFLDLIPFSETRDYVALISRNYFWYSHLYTTRSFRFDTHRNPAQAGSRPLTFRAFEPRHRAGALPADTAWVSLKNNENTL